jgi:hypothetical protein
MVKKNKKNKKNQGKSLTRDNGDSVSSLEKVKTKKKATEMKYMGKK